MCKLGGGVGGGLCMGGVGEGEGLGVGVGGGEVCAYVGGGEGHVWVWVWGGRFVQVGWVVSEGVWGGGRGGRGGGGGNSCVYILCMCI